MKGWFNPSASRVGSTITQGKLHEVCIYYNCIRVNVHTHISTVDEINATVQVVSMINNIMLLCYVWGALFHACTLAHNKTERFRLF